MRCILIIKRNGRKVWKEKLNGCLLNLFYKFLVLAHTFGMRNGEGNGYWVTDAYKRLYGSPGEKQEYMYYGEWKDNKPHGKGTLYEYAGSDVLIEVRFYEGEFKDGYFHGYGEIGRASRRGHGQLEGGVDGH